MPANLTFEKRKKTSCSFHSGYCAFLRLLPGNMVYECMNVIYTKLELSGIHGSPVGDAMAERKLARSRGYFVISRDTSRAFVRAGASSSRSNIETYGAIVKAGEISEQRRWWHCISCMKIPAGGCWQTSLQWLALDKMADLTFAVACAT
jgi:hypothetical protein